MTLPSAKPAGLPTAQSAPGSINSVDLCVEILKVSCPVALNLSELPDGRYRATALFSDARKWATVTETTMRAALQQLLKELSE